MLDVRAKPTKKLILEPTCSLRVGLGRALSGVLGYALECVGKVDRDPERSVHGFRKSVRRGRAVVKLARQSLDPADYALLAHELRSAVRATSPLRDADVLLARTHDLSHAVGIPAPAPFLAALKAKQRAAHADGVAAEALARGAAGFALFPGRFAAALPPGLTVERQVPAALGRSYKAARRARSAVAKGGGDEAVHDWRKRVKELRYAMEMVRDWLPGAPGVQDALASLAEGLGDTTDRMILAAALASFGDGHRLIDALEGAIAERVAGHIEATEELFEPGPRRFVAALRGE